MKRIIKETPEYFADCYDPWDQCTDINYRCPNIARDMYFYSASLPLRIRQEKPSTYEEYLEEYENAEMEDECQKYYETKMKSIKAGHWIDNYIKLKNIYGMRPNEAPADYIQRLLKTLSEHPLPKSRPIVNGVEMDEDKFNKKAGQVWSDAIKKASKGDGRSAKLIEASCLLRTLPALNEYRLIKECPAYIGTYNSLIPIVNNDNMYKYYEGNACFPDEKYLAPLIQIELAHEVNMAYHQYGTADMFYNFCKHTNFLYDSFVPKITPRLCEDGDYIYHYEDFTRAMNGFLESWYNPYSYINYKGNPAEESCSEYTGIIEEMKHHGGKTDNADNQTQGREWVYFFLITLQNLCGSKGNSLYANDPTEIFTFTSIILRYHNDPVQMKHVLELYREDLREWANQLCDNIYDYTIHFHSPGRMNLKYATGDFGFSRGATEKECEYLWKRYQNDLKNTYEEQRCKKAEMSKKYGGLYATGTCKPVVIYTLSMACPSTVKVEPPKKGRAPEPNIRLSDEHWNISNNWTPLELIRMW